MTSWLHRFKNQFSTVAQIEYRNYRKLHHNGSSTTSHLDAVSQLMSTYIKDLFTHSKVFIHHTNDKLIADRILVEGFKYSDNFYKTSEELLDNIVNQKYKLQLYKDYGKYVIIICIPSCLSKGPKSKKLNLDNDILVEYGICKYNSVDELCYTLPPNFIRGYIDIEEIQIVNNEGFGLDFKNSK